MASAPLSTRIPQDLDQRMRGAVVGMLAVDPRYTLAQFVADAIDAHCARLEREHHEGAPWEPPSRPLKPGSRIAGRG